MPFDVSCSYRNFFIMNCPLMRIRLSRVRGVLGCRTCSDQRSDVTDLALKV